MKKYEGILLLSDVDGTLMGGGSLPSRENAEAIKYFTENGGMFSIASGRNACEIHRIIHGMPSNSPLVPIESAPHTPYELSVNMPAICYNGAMIYSFKDEKILWENPLDAKAAVILEDIFGAFPSAECYVYTQNNVYAFTEPFYGTKCDASFKALPESPVFYKDIKETWLKLLFRYSPTDKINAFIKTRPYKNDFQFFRSGDNLYEALSLTATKGHAMTQLKKMYPEIKTVVAAGDNENDLELIKRSDIGCAVANASDILKKHADTTVVSYNNHAIAYIINNIIK